VIGANPVVDADAHINEPVVRLDPPPGEMTHWEVLATRHPQWQRPGRSGGKTVNLVDGKLYPTQEGRGRGVPVESALNPAAADGAGDLAARLQDLDAEGIDMQVLYGALSLGVTTFSDVGLADDFCRAYNDWLHDVCAAAPSRLFGAAVVALQDVDRAIVEMGRTQRQGAVAVTIPPVVGDANLDDPSFTGFFEAAADLGIAVAIHSAPGMNVPLPGAERFDNYAQVHCLSFPVDQMVALTALAMGGVLDRYPSLKVVFLESGVGWVPYYVHRMEEHREKRGELVPGMVSSPREYLDRGQCYFSFECEEPMLDAYIDHLGYRSLVFSSDYPHWDCEFPGTVARFAQTASSLLPEALAAIAATNAFELYGIPPGTSGS